MADGNGRALGKPRLGRIDAMIREEQLGKRRQRGLREGRAAVDALGKRANTKVGEETQ